MLERTLKTASIHISQQLLQYNITHLGIYVYWINNRNVVEGTRGYVQPLDYVSSRGIPLMPVLYPVVGFGRATASNRVITLQAERSVIQ